MDNAYQADAEQLFYPYIKGIFSGRNKKDMSVDDSSAKQQRLGDFLGFNYNGSAVTQKYHLSILSQAQSLTALFSVLFSVVTVFICVMVAFIILREYDAKLLVPLIVSGVVDLLSGGLIIVMKNLSESRDSFFQESVKAEYFAKVIGMIHQIDNESTRLALVQGVLDSYLVQFHQDGTDQEYFNKILELVNSVASEEKKLPLIERLIELHFRRPSFPTAPAASSSSDVAGSGSYSQPDFEDDGRSTVSL